MNLKPWLKSNFFVLTSIILLFYAAVPRGYHDRLPYGFYQILRFLVCGTAAYCAFKVFSQGRQAWAWILGITAALFNPLIPIRFEKNNWQMIDFIVAIMLFIFLLTPKKFTIKWLKQALITFGISLIAFFAVFWVIFTIQRQQNERYFKKLFSENKRDRTRHLSDVTGTDNDIVFIDATGKEIHCKEHNIIVKAVP